MSVASRRTAEKRAALRKLSGITFIPGALLDAGDYCPCDDIDCCGVLHHLQAPQAWLDAWVGALA